MSSLSKDPFSHDHSVHIGKFLHSTIWNENDGPLTNMKNMLERFNIKVKLVEQYPLIIEKANDSHVSYYFHLSSYGSPLKNLWYYKTSFIL